MLAVDTSSMIAFFAGEHADDVNLIHSALQNEALVLPLPVLAELLSDPKLPDTLAHALHGLPTLDIQDGFCQRVGTLRATVLAQHKKARLADALIAQCCLDHNIALVTRDKDFRHFEQVAGLQRLPHPKQSLI